MKNRTLQFNSSKFLRIGFLTAALLGLVLFAAPKTVMAAACTSTSSGSWLNPLNWSCPGGSILGPQDGDAVTIATGHTVTVSLVDTASLASLTVNGTLSYDGVVGVDVIVSGNVLVAAGGVIRTENPAGAHSHELLIGGSLTNNGTMTLINGNDVVNVTFNGTGAQTIGGSSSTAFNALTINNTGGSVTLNTAASVAGSLFVSSDLTAAALLTHSGTCVGAGDVVGTVSRSDQGTTTRCFGAVNNQITFPSGSPAGAVTVRLVKSNPGGFTTTNIVARYYEILSAPWAGGGAILRLRYLQSELPVFVGGTTESDLVLFKNEGTKFLQEGGTLNALDNYIILTGISSFSYWAFAAASTPTNVALGTFKAEAFAAQVKLDWTTGSEHDILGFNVWRRAAGAAGNGVRLNTQLIAAEDSGSITGNGYSFTDTSVTPGAFSYRLELRLLDGSSDWSESVDTTVPDGAATCAGALKATLVSPKPQASLKKKLVKFNWDDAACASSYKLIVRSGSKSGPVALKRKLNESEYTTDALEAGTYHWLVKSCAAGKCVKSERSSFTLKP